MGMIAASSRSDSETLQLAPILSRKPQTTVCIVGRVAAEYWTSQES
jgi:hypothetical protein